MVTLLMTFFVLMFAISNVDQQKALLFFAGLSRDGLTTAKFQEIVDRFGIEPDDVGDRIPIQEDEIADIDTALADLAELVSAHIADQGLEDDIKLVFNGEFLLLTLAGDIWFVSGSSEITAEMRDRAVDLAHLLAATAAESEREFEIVVAGHTDNVPIKTVRYPSNWHLSKDRATNFLEILFEEGVELGLDPSNFYARTCGEYRPVDTNDTPEGRQNNRRVEVMISLLREDQRILRGHELPHPRTPIEIATNVPTGAQTTPQYVIPNSQQAS